MKKIIRLTENDLHCIVKNSVRNIIKEIGGVYPDGQIDMFFNQDDVDTYRTDLDDKMLQGLITAEKSCGWGHSEKNEMGRYTVYTCYPKSGMHKSRNEFINMILKLSPRKDLVHFVKNVGGMTDAFLLKIDKA